MTAAELVNRLEDCGSRVRQTSNGWTAQCPAHDDRYPSLSVAEGNDGRVLINCFAGCDTEAICGELGLDLGDLMPPTDRAPHPKPRRPAKPIYYGPQTLQEWVQGIRITTARAAARKRPRKPRPAINTILNALGICQIDWRSTTDPGLWWTAKCPYCDAPDLWVHAPDGQPLTIACADGCQPDAVLTALETLCAIREAT